MNPITTRRTILCLLALSVIGVCTAVSSQLGIRHEPVRSAFRPDEGDATADMQPLWEDSYQPLPDGVPPWPRGLSREQADVLKGAESVVVATIDPYHASQPNVFFHGHEVLGARAYLEPDNVEEIVSQLIESIRDQASAADEFYPAYALRFTSRNSDGNPRVVDVLIGPSYGGMYVLTPTELRFCVVDQQIAHLLRELTDGLPQEYVYE